MYNKKLLLNLITTEKVHIPQTYSDIVKVTIKIFQLLFFMPFSTTEAFTRECSEKFRKRFQKTPVMRSPFYGYKPTTLTNKDSTAGVFLRIS